MGEWFKPAVLKTVEVKASGGSNPSLSAERSGQNQTNIRQNPTNQQFVGFFVSNKSTLKDRNWTPKDIVLCLNRYLFHFSENR